MDLAKFSWLALEKKLYLPRSDKLGDPFEGSMTEVALADQRDEIIRQNEATAALPNVTEKHRNLIRSTTKTSNDHFRRSLYFSRYLWYISCWHMADHESAGMWKLYGLSDQAVAIKTTASRLSALFDDAVIAAVRYINYKSEGWPPFSVLTPFLYKQISFSHENEARVLVHYNFSGLLDENATPHGIVVELEPNYLINEIFVNPEATKMFFDVVKKISISAGITSPVLKSDLARSPLW